MTASMAAEQEPGARLWRNVQPALHRGEVWSKAVANSTHGSRRFSISVQFKHAATAAWAVDVFLREAARCLGRALSPSQLNFPDKDERSALDALLAEVAHTHCVKEEDCRRAVRACMPLVARPLAPVPAQCACVCSCASLLGRVWPGMR
jgi:hypothetical protein